MWTAVEPQVAQEPLPPDVEVFRHGPGGDGCVLRRWRIFVLLPTRCAPSREGIFPRLGERVPEHGCAPAKGEKLLFRDWAHVVQLPAFGEPRELGALAKEKEGLNLAPQATSALRRVFHELASAATGDGRCRGHSARQGLRRVVRGLSISGLGCRIAGAPLDAHSLLGQVCGWVSCDAGQVSQDTLVTIEGAGRDQTIVEAGHQREVRAAEAIRVAGGLPEKGEVHSDCAAQGRSILLAVGELF
mmetsp:Transcript_16077/g.47178  ORF Transcript_16077/g.47178 Transcript_16077/m.47178 type:complete len:244 (-) Transcript_16077:47-778(-)